jgi:hypothetical protein
MAAAEVSRRNIIDMFEQATCPADKSPYARVQMPNYRFPEVASEDFWSFCKSSAFTLSNEQAKSVSVRCILGVLIRRLIRLL